MADLTIILKPEEWQVVLDAMADGRHRVVAPVIQRIIEQVQQQQQEPPPQQRLHPVVS